jgi:mono/diheme cytochrome c family protein
MRRLIFLMLTVSTIASCSRTDVPQAQVEAAEPQQQDGQPQSAEVTKSLAIFEQRILPIFQSPKPSSCAECHLSSVDLKEYIHPTQQETFASLAAADLIDTKKPDNSKILHFISRRPEQPSLVSEMVRQQEYEAFRAWIQAAVNDPTLLAAKDKAEPVGPKLPVEIVRHARKDRVLASFVENVWSEFGRCAACHSPDRNQKQVKEHGEQVSWIKLRDPQGTLNHMLEAGLIDTDEPEKSLLLAKPTMQVEHGGGQKMVVGDRSYKQFRRFIDDYAAVVHGQYIKTDQLPPPSEEVSVVTDIWLKIEGVPAKYDKMLLQADLCRRTDSGWSEYRVATSDRPVFGPKNLWQHSLSLTAPRGSKWAEQIASERLPPGRYLVKLYIDQTGKLQKDFTAELGEEDFVGHVEVESRWPAGYGQMTVVKFPAE